MTTAEPILAGLQHLHRVNRPLDLLNLYKGVPVVYPAFVESLSEAGVALRVPSFQVVCLALEPTTIILSQLLEESVSAEILSVDLAAGRVALHHLQYASHHVGDRMTVRVAPREPVSLPVECGIVTLRGQLTDLSINGLGLHVSAAEAAALRPRAVVRLRLPLPPTAATASLDLSGTIRFVRAEGELVRVGITFAQDVQMLAILPYVRERQHEILAELENVYRSRLATPVP